MKISRRFGRIVAACSLTAGITASVRAQDCAPSPLLGRRAAVGLGFAHADGEDGLSLDGAVGIATHVRLNAGYAGTRLSDVDRLRHQVNAAVAAPFDFSVLQLCPTAGGSLARLSTDHSALQGQVTSREAFYGGSVGAPFAISSRVRFTPFVEPLVVYRTVSWKSVDGSWIVSGHDHGNQTQLWWGASLATSRSALVVRMRPARADVPSAVAIGVDVAFGR